MKITNLSFRFIWFLPYILAFNSASPLPHGFKETEICDNFASIFLVPRDPDLLYNGQKKGIIEIIKNDVLQPKLFLDIQKITDNHYERGLLGFVFHPDFENTGYYYVYYTVLEKNVNRLSRFTATEDGTDISTELVMLETELLTSDFHMGGLMFIKEGKIILFTGDVLNPDTPQSLNSLFGKVLRLNLDGTIPDDNPFYKQTEGKFRAIFAIGLRNPSGGSVQVKSERIFFNDRGQGWEEVNELKPGKNYGWPIIEGYSVGDDGPENLEDPIYAYYHNESACRITGGVFYIPKTSTFPDYFQGSYLFGDYCSEEFKLLDIASNTILNKSSAFSRRILNIAVANNGDLYYFESIQRNDVINQLHRTSLIGRLLKLQFVGNAFLSISSHPKNITTNENVHIIFEVDINGDPPFTFQWFKDNMPISNARNRTYSTLSKLSLTGSRYHVVVTNNMGNITSNPAYLNVFHDNKLTVTITSPIEGAKYQAGTFLNYSGYAQDANGNYKANKMSWEILFHNQYYTYQAMPSTKGISKGSFYINNIVLPEWNVWYEIILTVSDETGIKKSTRVKIHPETSIIKFESSPPGLKFLLDNKEYPTPYTLQAVSGSIKNIAGVKQVHKGNTYNFESWSDKKEKQHDVIIDGKSDKLVIKYKKIGTMENSLNYKYYEIEDKTLPSDLQKLRPKKEGKINAFDLSLSDHTSNYAIVFSGYFYAQEEDYYKFTVFFHEDAKTFLFINSQTQQNAPFRLVPGSHSFKLIYFQHKIIKDPFLKVLYASTDRKLDLVSFSSFYPEDPNPCIHQSLTYESDISDFVYYKSNKTYTVKAVLSSLSLPRVETEGPVVLIHLDENFNAKIRLKPEKGVGKIKIIHPGDSVYCPLLTKIQEFHILDTNPPPPPDHLDHTFHVPSPTIETKSYTVNFIQGKEDSLNPSPPKIIPLVITKTVVEPILDFEIVCLTILCLGLIGLTGYLVSLNRKGKSQVGDGASEIRVNSEPEEQNLRIMSSRTIESPKAQTVSQILFDIGENSNEVSFDFKERSMPKSIKLD